MKLSSAIGGSEKEKPMDGLVLMTSYLLVTQN